MDDKYKTTDEHFRIFRQEGEYWIDRLSLRSWEVAFFHTEDDDYPDARAWASWDEAGMIACIGLSPTWFTKDNPALIEPNRKEVCLSAFHEVCEVLLAQFFNWAMCDAGSGQKREIRSRKHAIIRRLEHALWLPDWEMRDAADHNH